MSITSKVEIWNLAVGHLRSPAVISSENDNTKEAAACRLYYEHARTITLEAFDWGFARQTQLLAELDPDDEGWNTDLLRGWGYAYVIPTTCQKFRRIWDTPERKVPYEIVLRPGVVSSQMILTNMSDAIGVFTASIEIPTLFPAHFVDALSWRLAAFAAPKLTGDNNFRRFALAGYRDALDMAEEQDAATPSAERATEAQASWIDER